MSGFISNDENQTNESEIKLIETIAKKRSAELNSRKKLHLSDDGIDVVHHRQHRHNDDAGAISNNVDDDDISDELQPRRIRQVLVGQAKRPPLQQRHQQPPNIAQQVATAKNHNDVKCDDAGEEITCHGNGGSGYYNSENDNENLLYAQDSNNIIDNHDRSRIDHYPHKFLQPRTDQTLCGDVNGDIVLYDDDGEYCCGDHEESDKHDNDEEDCDDFMRLDTIVEEDENAAAAAAAGSHLNGDEPSARSMIEPIAAVQVQQGNRLLNNNNDNKNHNNDYDCDPRQVADAAVAAATPAATSATPVGPHGSPRDDSNDSIDNNERANNNGARTQQNDVDFDDNDNDSDEQRTAASDNGNPNEAITISESSNGGGSVSTTGTIKNNTGGSQSATNNNSKQSTMQQPSVPLLLPSTNRLISEHQARQQQTLFRALAERQKLLDELGPAERRRASDLMSLSTATLARQVHRQSAPSSSSASTSASAARHRRSGSGSGNNRSSNSNSSNSHRHQEQLLLPVNQQHRTQRSSKQVPLSPQQQQATTAATSNNNYSAQATRQTPARLTCDSSAQQHTCDKQAPTLMTDHNHRLLDGVPLSSVDLSSMPDRLLDELLGHIASASSGSSCSSSSAASTAPSSRSSAHGDDSSSCGGGCSADEDDDLLDDDDDDDSFDSQLKTDDDEAAHAGTGRSHHQAGAAKSATTELPNVIGVHGDDVSVNGALLASGRHQRRLANSCRSDAQHSTRPRATDDDEDDDRGDGSSHHRRKPPHQSLSVRIGAQQHSNQSQVPAGEQSMGGSPAGGGGSGSSSLSSLLSPRTGAGAGAGAPGAGTAPPTDTDIGALSSGEPPTVEAVLGQMLEAINGAVAGPGQVRQAGEGAAVSASAAAAATTGAAATSAPHSEHLNELLERGFVHLERLLNCSLAAPASRGTGQQQQQQAPHQSAVGQAGASEQRQQSVQPPTKSHLQQQQQQQQTGQLMQQNNVSLSKDSDYGSDTQSADCFSHCNTNAPEQQQQQQQQTLSPVAIELSLRLAESLRQLAQQQQTMRRQANGGGGGAGANERDSRSAMQSLSPEVGVAGNAISNGTGNSNVVGGSSSSNNNNNNNANRAKRTPMKTVVHINSDSSPRPNSATSVSTTNTLSQRSRSTTPANDGGVNGNNNNNNNDLPIGSQSQSAAQSSRSARNMTPLQQQQQFKTCVSIGSKTSSSAQGASSEATTTTSRSPPAATITLDGGPIDCDETTTTRRTKQVDQVEDSQQQQQQAILSDRQASLRRRRSTRRSSRSLSRQRQVQQQQTGASRPGSPLPRLASEQQAHQQLQQQVPFDVDGTKSSTSTSAAKSTSSTTAQAVAMASNTTILTADKDFSRELDSPFKSGSGNSGTSNGDAAVAGKREQRKLQRAIEFAQRYNYSPAKLVASKITEQLAGAPRESVPCSPVAGPQQAAFGSVDGSGQTDKQVRHNIANTNNGDAGQYAIRSFAGQIELDIGYFARSGSLTIHIIRCLQLQPMNKRRATSNPYVKLYLLPDRSKSGKRKSAVRKHTLEPVFDEKFTFGPMQLAEFDQKLLWIGVLHKTDRLAVGRNELIGELLLPMAQVRHQLLTSDLCQYTSAKLYTLTARNRIGEQQISTTTYSTGNNKDNANDITAAATTNKLNTTTPTLKGRRLPVKQLPEHSNNNDKNDSYHSSSNINTAASNNSNDTGTGTANRLQVAAPPAKTQQLVDKLTELERKAARLSTCAMMAAPPGGLRTGTGTGNGNYNNMDLATSFGRPSESKAKAIGSGASCAPQVMNVYLGPLADVNMINNVGSTTTGASLSVHPSITGQLFVALKFVPENTGETLARRSDRMEGTLHVLIKEARNIAGFEAPPMLSALRSSLSEEEAGAGTGTGENADTGSNKDYTSKQQQQQIPAGPLPNPFCKCYLLNSNGARVARQRTPQLKRTSNPRWDFECKFNQLKLSQLQAQAVEIHLLNRDSILVKNNELLGAIRLCQSQPPDNNKATTKSNNNNNNSTYTMTMTNDTTTTTTTTANHSQETTNQSSANQFEPLCSERESRLWTQMLARPNIWVYGELPLALIRPLVPIDDVETNNNNI